MPSYQLEIINQALSLIGDTPLSTLDTPDDDDAPSAAVIASNLYNMARDQGFNRSFRFTQVWSELSEYAAIEDKIPPGWDRAFARPSGAIVIKSVLNSLGHRQIYHVFEDVIAVRNIGGNSTEVLTCVYTNRTDESKWPPDFKLGVVYTLAAYFASSIVENASMAKNFFDMAEVTWARLGRTEAQSQSPQRVDTSLLLRGRRGRGTYRVRPDLPGV